MRDIPYIINFLGSVLAIYGAVANCIGNYRVSFGIWIISNSLLLIMFTGIYYKKWTLNSGSLFQMIMFTVYLGTSIYGYIRVT
jgi:hypothetical protein